MRNLYEIFKVLKIQKRIVSGETIRGNTERCTSDQLNTSSSGFFLKLVRGASFRGDFLQNPYFSSYTILKYILYEFAQRPQSGPIA